MGSPSRNLELKRCRSLKNEPILLIELLAVAEKI
jgi:hypothetical protein